MDPIVNETPYGIVVVDDESTVCDLLRRGLNEDNFLVTSVLRADQALDVILKVRPCLVILDIHMPQRNGLEVLKDLREAAPRIPVVMLSGGATAEERDEARRLGACEVLNKPVNWAYLRRIAYLYSCLNDPLGHNEKEESNHDRRNPVH